jgi:hypothetical protein
MPEVASFEPSLPGSLFSLERQCRLLQSGGWYLRSVRKTVGPISTKIPALHALTLLQSSKVSQN